MIFPGFILLPELLFTIAGICLFLSLGKFKSIVDMEYEEVQVECHSGYKVNEYPVAFTFQGQRRSVSEIVDRWYEGGTTPDKPVIDYFKIKTDEGNICILLYSGHEDQWFIRC